jgi:phage tail sheath protein FI
MIWDPPADWQSADAAMFGARRLGFSSASVMSYFPRIRPRGASARFVGGLPACGAIAGIIARRDRRGIFGRDEDSDYTLRAALAPVESLDAADAQRLARCGINAFLHTTGGATRLIGRVTFSANGPGRASGPSLDRRRLLNFVLSSVDEVVADATAEPDHAMAIDRLELQLGRFFEQLHRHGALAGATPDQAYYVRCQRPTAGTGTELRFGLAVATASGFSEYRIALSGAGAGVVQAAPRLEADQLFS